MHSLLFGDPADEGEKGNVVLKIIAFEVPLLQQFLRL